MANNLYYNYANKLLGLAAAAHAQPDMDAGTIRACLIDHTDVTPDVTTHQDLDDIDTPTVVATSANMTGTIANGAVDFPDFAFTTVTGDAADSLNFYDWALTTASTAPLIAYYDTATGLPVTPNGADINVALNASGLYKLVV